MSSDRFFIDSPVLREFSKTAMDKGWLKQEPIVKQAAAKVEVTGNLDNDLASLISHLQDRGMSKEAKAIEDKYLSFKGAQLAVNRLIDEEAKQLLMAAHPSGDTKVMEASNGWGVSHTGLSAQEKTLSILSTSGIPRMASQNKKMIKKVAEALGMISVADIQGEKENNQEQKKFISPKGKKILADMNVILGTYQKGIFKAAFNIAKGDFSGVNFVQKGAILFPSSSYNGLYTLCSKYSFNLSTPLTEETIDAALKAWYDKQFKKLTASSTTNEMVVVAEDDVVKKWIQDHTKDIPIIGGGGSITNDSKEVSKNDPAVLVAAKLSQEVARDKAQIIQLFNMTNKEFGAGLLSQLIAISSTLASLTPVTGATDTPTICLNAWVKAGNASIAYGEKIIAWANNILEKIGSDGNNLSDISNKVALVNSFYPLAVNYLKGVVNSLSGAVIDPAAVAQIVNDLAKASSNLEVYLRALPKEKRDKERESVESLKSAYMNVASSLSQYTEDYCSAEQFEIASGGYNLNEMQAQVSKILSESAALVPNKKSDELQIRDTANHLVNLTKVAQSLPSPSEKGVGKPSPTSGSKPSGGGGAVVPNNYSSKPLTPDSQAIQRMQMLLNQFGLYLNRDPAKAKLEFLETYNQADANRIIMVGPNATHPADFDGTWGPNTSNALATTNKYLTAKKLSNVTTARGTGAQADANSEILRSLLDELKVSTGEPGAVKSIVYDKISTPVIMTDISGDGDVPVTNKDLSSLLAFYDFLLKKNVVTTVDPKAGIPARNFWVALAWFNARALAINSYAGKPMGNTVSDKNNFKNNSKSYYNATQSLIKDFNRWAKLNGLSSDEELDSTVIDRASIAAALPTSGMGSAKNPQGYALGPDGKPLLGPSGKPIRDSRMGFMPSNRNHGGDEFVESVEDEGEGTLSKTDMPIQKTINLSATGPDGAPWWDMADTYNGFISISRTLNKHAVIVAQTLFPGDVGDEYKLQQDWMRGAGYQNLGWNESAGSFMYLDRANNQRGLVTNNPDFKKSRTYNTSSTSVAQYRAFLNRLGGQMGRVLQDWQTRMQPDAAAWENQQQAATVWNQVISRQLKQLQGFERNNR